MILNSPYITGSITVTGNTTIQGSLIVTGSLSGTASLASNSNLLQGTGSVGFATTASLLEVSSSQQQISSSLLQVSASLLTLTASYAALSSSYISLSASYNTFSGSASIRTTQIEQTYATTGSNSFRANQSITGSLVVSSTITAQTLVVQTVTSSIVYSSGSNLFGSALGDRQTFTGSVNITGSLIVNTTGTEFQVNSNGVVMGNLSTDNHAITGSLNMTGSLGINAASSFRFNGVGDNSHAVGYDATVDGAFLRGQNGIRLITGGGSGIERMRISAAGTASFTSNTLSNSADAATINLKQNSTTANTGIYLERSGEQKGYYIYMGGSVDSLTFQRNNAGTKADVMSLTRDGNVGIGTITPLSALDVRAANATMGNYQTIQAFSTDSAAINLGGGISLGGYYTSTTSIAQFASIVGRKENGTSGNYDGYLAFGTNAQATGVVERMRITSAGNILINQTSALTGVPTSIEISGVGSSSPTLQASYNIYANHGVANTTWRGYYVFNKSRGTTAGSVTAVASEDYLGTIRWNGADGTGQIIGAEINARVDGDVGTDDMPTRLEFSTTLNGASSPTNRLTITNSGVISINNSSTEANAGLDRFTLGYAVSNYGWMQTWASTPLYLNRLGNNVSAYGSAGFGLITTTSSDVRIKKNIVPIESALDKVNALRGVYYEFNKDNELKVAVPHGKTRIGLIAQEVETIIPEAVIDGDNEGTPKSVDYTGLVGVLVKAIQELKAEIEELKNK